VALVVACSPQASSPSPDTSGYAYVQVASQPELPDGSAACAIPVFAIGGTLVVDNGTLLTDPTSAESLATCQVGPMDAGYSVAATTGRGASSLSIVGTAEEATSHLRMTIVHEGRTFASSAPCTLTPPVSSLLPYAFDGLVVCPEVTDDDGNTCYASAQVTFDACVP
jgi:hypothetical protein